VKASDFEDEEKFESLVELDISRVPTLDELKGLL